jgi:hypothetical protein
MFSKTLKIVKNGITVLEVKIIPIFNKPNLFLPGDRLFLFGSKDIEHNFKVPKKSQVFIGGDLVGLSGASGSLDIKSDHFTGVLHALYLVNI